MKGLTESMKNVIGVIGAMQSEVDLLIAKMNKPKKKEISGTVFYCGKIEKKNVVVAKCGVGKVFAALATEALILNFRPALVVNTGVAGTMTKEHTQGDIVYAEKLVQHDMDTSAVGDPVGMVSGINKIFFETDEKARRILAEYAKSVDFPLVPGVIASGDQFINTEAAKAKIIENFGASVCEMEGAPTAHVCFVNETPCAVIRAISDGADENVQLSYGEFLPLAAKRSAEITLELIKNY